MYNVFNLNYFKSLYLSIKYGKMYVYRKESTKIRKSSHIINNGVIFLNKDHNSNPKNFNYGYFKVGDNAKLIVNKRLLLRPGVRFEIEDNAKLEVDDCTINYNTKIYCFDNIKIGKNVIISENVTIRDSDNHCINDSRICSPIVIDDNVWIGMNSVILKGVHIGSGAVVAAGSIVTKNVTANTLVAGVPAKVIKENIKWER